jgi:catechol 2,3-dioxygenase-like lactoylglutathione lyase family enzyme
LSAFPSAISAISLFVPDLAAAKAFYARVFDLPPLFEDAESVAFRFGSTIVNLLVETSAPELIEPATVAPADAGSRMQLTIPVDDADAVSARLRQRGVTLLNGPIDRAWGVRTAAFADPAGHVWEIAQELNR